jgi:hypothetical protein
VVGSDLCTDISNVLNISSTLLVKYYRMLIKLKYVQYLGSVNILRLLWPGGANTRQLQARDLQQLYISQGILMTGATVTE